MRLNATKDTHIGQRIGARSLRARGPLAGR